MELTKVLKELERSDLSFRDDLYSEKFYETLRRINVSKVYTDECSSLGNLPFSTSVKRICAKVLEYLDTIYSKSYKQGDQYDVCLLLNYWVYSSLFNLLKIKGERFVYQAYAQLQLIWTDFLEDKRYDKLCEPINDMVSHNDWRERKELYEYCIDYSPIKQIIDIFVQGCDEFYVYVENKARLYEHFGSRCPNDDTKICPNFYKDCEKYNPKNVLPDLRCHTKIKQERDAAAAKASQRGGTYPSRVINSEGTPVGMVPVVASQNLSGNPQTVENVGNIFLGVVATTMTSGALYRFTPLGNMLRNIFGWNTNNMRNFNGGDIRLYDYASDSFNPYPGEEHNIGYHPAQ
ncbi:Plasmodium vivax Vir protein, putative [Plasmodium vivax]|nr:Plasmodium vivax Vir protein, putative [Plasmodium vivax]